MIDIKEKILSVMSREALESIIIIVVGVIIYLISKKIITKVIEKNEKRKKLSKRQKTYVKLTNSIIRYIIIITVLISVLQVNGIDVTSIIAGLGVASVIGGLALQDALRDIIMGFNIIVDNYFSVGDVLKINDIEGKVIELGLKSTKMQDILTGNIYIISNRNITEAINISSQLDIDIPLPYEEGLEKIENIIQIIVDKISKLENVQKVEYKGLNEFGNSAIYYKIRIFTKPELRPQVKRNANRLIKLELDENNIEVPYTQIDIHSK